MEFKFKLAAVSFVGLMQLYTCTNIAQFQDLICVTIIYILKVLKSYTVAIFN